MKITKVEYEFCANLGNYQNEKVRMIADIEEGETYLEVLENLKKMVHNETHSEKEYFEMKDKCINIQGKLEQMQKAFVEGLESYEKMVAFSKFIGLNKDFPDFPKIPESVIGVLNGTKDDVECVDAEF